MAERYSFSIQSKTKYNNNPQTFFVMYFASDAQAKAFAQWAETYLLPNHQKLNVSKLIRLGQGATLPSPADLTDMYTAKILLGTSQSSDKRTNVTIPLKPEAVIDDLTAYLIDPQHGVVFSDDTPINRVVSYQLTGRNIVAGGPVAPSSSTPTP